MNTSKIKLLELHGNPFERGLIYGKKYAEHIKQIIRIFNAIIKLDFIKKEPEKFLSKYYEKQNCISSIKQYTPGLWDEIDGLVEGSD